jgi:hypothetical protein
MIVWDDIWGQEEYRITFTDRAGRPVQGVELRVENEAGSTFYHFPVTDSRCRPPPSSARSSGWPGEG